MATPSVRYATTADGASIAYWTMGSGPPLVLLPARFFFTPSTWNEMDEVGAFNDRLAARNTVIHLDHRGYGLSDPATVPAPMDDLIADIDAVVDGLGLEHIALLGQTFSTALAINYAVQRPGRLSHLILWCGITSWDEYIQAPQAQTLAVVREQGDWHTFTETVWQVIYGWAESEMARHYAAKLRDTVGREAVIAHFNRDAVPDVSDLLARVSAPTLVLARQDGYYGIDGSRMLATKIPDAHMVVQPGTSAALWTGDVEATCAEIDAFLTYKDESGEGSTAHADPGPFRTILFTDVVASTPLLAQLKDERMRTIMRDHDAVLQAAVDEHEGRVVKTIGDAFMADFAVPSSAVECAIAMQRGIREQFADSDVPIRLRIGINAGEPIAEDDDLHGASVVIAKRLESAAATNGILVSDVVKQMVMGKDFEFADQGEVALKGFEEPVRAWAVAWQ